MKYKALVNIGHSGISGMPEYFVGSEIPENEDRADGWLERGLIGEIEAEPQAPAAPVAPVEPEAPEPVVVFEKSKTAKKN